MLWVSSSFSLIDVGTHLGCKRFWGISGLSGALLGLNKWEKGKSWWHRPSFFAIKKAHNSKNCVDLQSHCNICIGVSYPWPLSGGEGTVNCISELLPSSPDPIVSTLLAKEAQSQYFWLVNIPILLSLIALSTAVVLFLPLLISTSIPSWHDLSTSLSSWSSFCVFDTVLSSFVVSFPSSVPLE